ncbi:MAG: hypothetical protein HZC10_03810 [Nitrospirae bacterium]|nr:hypothetical protein [Nitrospirota bacterium]
MRIITLALTFITFIAAIAFVGNVMAVPPEKTLEFAGGAMGKIIFDGKVHADKGLKCNDCHTKPFPMKGPNKEGSVKITAPHKIGEFCGACHNGEKAFSVVKDCAKCHKKAAAGY